MTDPPTQPPQDRAATPASSAPVAARMSGEPATPVVPGPEDIGQSTDESPVTTLPLPDLRRYVAYRLVSSFGFTGGIWIIFLRDRGLSLAEIGVAEAAFHLAAVLLELPSGSLADTFGRKWSLAASSLVGTIALLLTLAVHDLWLAIPALFLSGASMCFASGASDAFLYDAMAAGGTTDRFTAVFGRLLSVSFLVIGLSTWAGAAMAEIDFAVPYLLGAGFGLLGTLLALTLREPDRAPPAHRNVRRTIVDAVAIARGHPATGRLILFGAAFWTTVTLIELYAQAVLADLGLATWVIGLVIGGSFVLVAAGSWLAARLVRRGSFRAWLIGLTTLTALAALALGSEVLALALVTFAAFEFGTGIMEPMLRNQVNQTIPSAQRATILSIEGFLFSPTMVWAFPLAGYLAERGGWLVAFGVISAALTLALAWWFVTDRRAPAPAPA